MLISVLAPLISPVQTHSSGITRTPTGPVLRTIEDLVLITHDIYGIVEYVITPEATELPCRLQLYALEMTDPGAVDATARPGENADPHQTEQYRARNIATFNLPSWRRQAIISKCDRLVCSLS